MNQEKNEMQMSSAGEYLAPSVKMVEVKVRKVLCGSGKFGSGAPTKMDDGVEDAGTNWY